MNNINVEDVDWNNIDYNDKAVLCFILSGNEILLILKKKGLGAGKINAPGGRIEPGETEMQAAIRETEEEVGLIPHSLKKMAELNFLFTSGYTLWGSVFIASGHSGTMRETDEAIPYWYPKEKIPYHRMWEDDYLWLPRVLAGISLKGYFVFDDDENMLSKKIIEIPGF